MISRRRSRLALTASVLLLAGLPTLRGAEEEPAVPAPSAAAPRMDYGSMLTYTVGLPSTPGRTNENLALKGVCIRLGGSNEAAICFDTDLLRYHAGWTGGFLDLSRTHLTSSKGSWHALIQGDVQFSTGLGPGWARGEDFADPRPIAAGPLPREWGRFKGVYRHGARVVLKYLVGETEVFETPDCVTTNGLTFFARTFHVGPTKAPLLLRLCDIAPDSAQPVAAGDGSMAGWVGEHATRARLSFVNPGGAPASGPARIDGLSTTRRVGDRRSGSCRVEATTSGRIQLRFPASESPVQLQVILWSGPAATATQEAGEDVSLPRINPKDFCRGGPAQWPRKLTTGGRLGFGGAYVVDTAIIPENNPWRSWMRLVAFDFFSDGRAAVSTWNGDVWLVSGLDDKLDRVTWKRFAAGLFEPLGLRIVNDEAFVLCRDQLMRLRDLNGDGEADFYECFNNDTWVSPSYHAFAFDLQTDRAGNFYYTRCGQRVDPALPLNGGMVKVSKDGSRAELIATGLRAANGMAIGPNGEIVCGDNQGNWIPSSRLNWIKPGGFFGYLPHARREPPPADYEKPICWLPMKADNSSGGQVWVTSDRWGPLQGRLLHTSYGRGALFLVLMEEVDGVRQGGVVQLPLKFDSGIMRARFQPRDGQLWVCGLQGWQTSGGRMGALQRVRYTGKPVHLPSALHVASNGVGISFTSEMDRASANDEQNFAVEQWNYEWSDKYGSPDFSVRNPRKQGRDSVDVKSARLAPDRKRVFLEIPGIQPVMQMRIRFRLKAADGAPVEHEIFNTINRVPESGQGGRGEREKGG